LTVADSDSYNIPPCPGCATLHSPATSQCDCQMSVKHNTRTLDDIYTNQLCSVLWHKTTFVLIHSLGLLQRLHVFRCKARKLT
jgi:hypothetical protein